MVWIIIGSVALVLLFIVIVACLMLSKSGKNKAKAKDKEWKKPENEKKPHVERKTKAGIDISDEFKYTEFEQPSEKPRIYGAPNEVIGKNAEQYVAARLRLLLEKDEYLLTNLLLPLGNDDETEIDAVIISRKGVFCIETKNWSGIIIGDSLSKFWQQQCGCERHRHLNPVLQNDGHCDALEKELNGEFEVNNFVIFANIESGSHINAPNVYKITDFVEKYQDMPDEIYPEDLDYIYDKLSCYESDEEELTKHAKQVKAKYNND